MKEIKIMNGKFYVAELMSGGIQLFDSDKTIICNLNCEQYGKGFLMNILEHKIFSIEEFKTFLSWFVVGQYDEFYKIAASVLVGKSYEELVGAFNFFMDTDYELTDFIPYFNRIGDCFFLVDTNFIKNDLKYKFEEVE